MMKHWHLVHTITTIIIQSTLTIMAIYCLSVRVPASQVPNHKIYKELQYNEEVGWILAKGALNWTIMHSIVVYKINIDCSIVA